MSWKNILKEESGKDYYKDLIRLVQQDAKTNTVYPDHSDVFNALTLTPLDKVKVVILGQDPYHGPNQAHGLAFSVREDCPIPPSLKNIFKEINSDLKLDHKFTHGNLTGWAKQGVLLLNTSLTVRESQPNSHKDFGWTTFTDTIIKAVAAEDRPIVFILWGAAARNKKKFVTSPKHLVWESAHPSPLSAHNGFFGSRPFSATNIFLVKMGLTEINWIDQ